MDGLGFNPLVPSAHTGKLSEPERCMTEFLAEGRSGVDILDRTRTAAADRASAPLQASRPLGALTGRSSDHARANRIGHRVRAVAQVQSRRQA